MAGVCGDVVVSVCYVGLAWCYSVLERCTSVIYHTLYLATFLLHHRLQLHLTHSTICFWLGRMLRRDAPCFCWGWSRDLKPGLGDNKWKCCPTDDHSHVLRMQWNTFEAQAWKSDDFESMSPIVQKRFQPKRATFIAARVIQTSRLEGGAPQTSWLNIHLY